MFHYQKTAQPRRTGSLSQPSDPSLVLAVSGLQVPLCSTYTHTCGDLSITHQQKNTTNDQWYPRLKNKPKHLYIPSQPQTPSSLHWSKSHPHRSTNFTPFPLFFVAWWKFSHPQKNPTKWPTIKPVNAEMPNFTFKYREVEWNASQVEERTHQPTPLEPRWRGKECPLH